MWRNVDEDYDFWTNDEHEETEMLIDSIIEFIETRSEEDEGEPPDNDTIEEAMGLSGAYCWDDVINEAYRRYYRRLR